MLGSRGRPRDQAPPGYITTSDAAEIWDVSAETIRNRIRNKTLAGKVVTLRSGERRYIVASSAVEEYRTWNGAQRLPWGDQGPGVEKLASRLDAIAERQDAIAERQENVEKRQESIEDAIGEVLASLQQQKQAAERERDELRLLFTHAASQATPPPLDTPVEDTNVGDTRAQNNDRTESPEVDKERGNDHTESPEASSKKGPRRRIDGRKVQLLREGAWLNRGQLAERAGLHPITIGAIESGKRPSPHRSTFFALARVLGVKPEELVTRD